MFRFRSIALKFASNCHSVFPACFTASWPLSIVSDIQVLIIQFISILLASTLSLFFFRYASKPGFEKKTFLSPSRQILQKKCWIRVTLRNPFKEFTIFSLEKVKEKHEVSDLSQYHSEYWNGCLRESSINIYSKIDIIKT